MILVMLKTKIVFGGLLGLLLAAFCLSSCSGTGDFDLYGSISGRITDVSTGEPLNAASVTIIPGAGTIQTSSDGVFYFSGLDEGQYTVSVQKNGYQPNRKNITVISGENLQVDIQLARIPQ